MSSLLKPLVKATDCKSESDEDRQDYLKRLVAEVNELDDDVWAKIPEESQEWANAGIRAVKAKAEIDDPDAPVAEEDEVEEDEAEEEAEEEEAEEDEAEEDEADEEEADEEEEGEDEEDAAEDEEAEDKEEEKAPVKKPVKKATKSIKKHAKLKAEKLVKKATKKSADVKVKKSAKVKVLGKYSAGTFVRWLGRRKVSFENAKKILEKEGCALKDVSIKMELREVRDGKLSAKVSKDDRVMLIKKYPGIFNKS